MRQICLSLPNYFTRVPDSSFILSETHEPTDGSRAGDKLIQGMRGDGWAMVHLPHGGTVNIDVSGALGAKKRGWKSWWIDPRTGGREVNESERQNSVQADFTAPRGLGNNEDWLLLLESVTGTSEWFNTLM